MFSLFSIVTFKNVGCTSSDGTTGTTGYGRVDDVINTISKLMAYFRHCISGTIEMALATQLLNVRTKAVKLGATVRLGILLI